MSISLKTNEDEYDYDDDDEVDDEEEEEVDDDVIEYVDVDEIRAFFCLDEIQS